MPAALVLVLLVLVLALETPRLADALLLNRKGLELRGFLHRQQTEQVDVGRRLAALHAAGETRLLGRPQSDSSASSWSCFNLTLAVLKHDWAAIEEWGRPERCPSAEARLLAWPAQRHGVLGLRALDGRPTDALRAFHSVAISGGMPLAAELAGSIKQAALRLPQVGVAIAGWPQSQFAPPEAAQPSPSILMGAQSPDGAWSARPYPVTDAWLLVGYDLWQPDLELGLPVRARLWWKQSASDATPGKDWVQASPETWVQTTLLLNLVPDSGLEWQSMTEAQREGLAGKRSEAFGGTWQPAREQENDSAATAALMGDDPAARVLEFTTARRIEVTPICHYMTAIRLKTRQTSVAFAMRWYGDREFNFIPVKDRISYITRNFSSPGWVDVAGAVLPIRGAREVVVTVGKQSRSGEVTIDNVLFAPIPDPDGNCPVSLPEWTSR